MSPMITRTFLLLLAGMAVFARAQNAPASSSAPPATSPPAQPEPIRLSPFEVSTTQDRGYAVTDSMGATRVALPTANISSSIVTINPQVFLDRAAVTSTEVLTLVSGIQQDSDRFPGQEQISLRGYATAAGGLRDGLPDPLATGDGFFDESSSYDRIEVIKGPAGVLYGSHSMGGVINKISKWPQFRHKTVLELQAQSSDEFLRGVVDSTGPLNDDLAYRVTLSGREGDRYYDEGDAPNNFYNTTLSFLRRIADGRGKTWFRGQYFDYEIDRENGWQFITGYLDPLNPGAGPIVTNPQYPLPRTANTVPEDDVSKGYGYALELGYEHSFAGFFDGDWTLRLVGRFSHRDGDKSPSYAQGRPIPVNAAGQIVQHRNAAGNLVNSDNRFIGANDPRVADWRATLVLRDFRAFEENGNFNMDMVGDFATGPANHKLILSAGAGTGESERSFFFWNAANPANTTAVANSFSAVRSTPAGVTAGSIRSGATTQYNPFQGHSEGWNFNAAVMDNVSFLENRLIVSAGIRYNNAHSTSARFDRSASIAAMKPVIDDSSYRTTDNSAWTNRYGIVGKPFPGISLFAQVSETFVPVSGLNAVTQQPLPNREGENKEVGIKVDLWRGRLVGTLSFFDMKLTNVLVAVPLPIEQGGGTVSLPVGSQNTEGWEFDLAAELYPGLNLIASYSDLDSTNENGGSFRGVPITANYALMGRYEFQKGNPLHGFYTGLAWKHTGVASGDSANSFFNEETDLLDAFVGYKRENWTLQLNAFNVTDTDETLSSVTDRLAPRVEPRAFRVTFRYLF